MARGRGISPLTCGIRAICFDLDGVLIHTMPLHARAWQEAGRVFGVPVRLRDIYAWEGESGKVSAKTLLTRQHPRVTRAAIASFLAEKERRFRAYAGRIPIDRPLTRLLPILRRRGYRLALVTGTSHGEVMRVVPASLRRMFHVIVTGDRVRRGKPHPDPYLTACRRLRIAPQRALIIENAPYGIRSATRAQAGVVLAVATSLPRRALAEADWVAGTTTELAALLDRLTTPVARR